MRRSKSDKRAKIVKAAGRLFQQQGYSNTSFRDLADQSGVPKGNFYYYFRSKDEVLTAVLDGRRTQLETQLEGLEAAFTDPLQRVSAFVHALLKDSTEPFLYGCPHSSLCIELVKGQTDRLDQGSAALRFLSRWFAAQFRAAGTNERPEPLALHLLGRIQGIILIGAALHDEEFARREIKQTRAWVESLPHRGGRLIPRKARKH